MLDTTEVSAGLSFSDYLKKEKENSKKENSEEKWQVISEDGAEKKVL